MNIPRSKKVPTSISVGGLLVRAERLHTPGETTLGPGGTTPPGDWDIKRNDRNSSWLVSRATPTGTLTPLT